MHAVGFSFIFETYDLEQQRMFFDADDAGAAGAIALDANLRPPLTAVSTPSLAQRLRARAARADRRPPSRADGRRRSRAVVGGRVGARRAFRVLQPADDDGARRWVPS